MKKAVCIAVITGLIGVGMPMSGHAKGGAGPFFASCCLGPRIGLELNEDVRIETDEWLGIIVPRPIMAIFQGAKNNGFNGYMASCCLGPRVGKQLHERRIRSKEWLLLVPYVGYVFAAIIAVEAGQGKTMTEIESAENLRK